MFKDSPIYAFFWRNYTDNYSRTLQDPTDGIWGITVGQMISATTANIGPLDVRSSLSRLLAGYVSDLETIQENPSIQTVANGSFSRLFYWHSFCAYHY